MGEFLVGVDGSEMSRAALRWAASVASARGGTVRAVTAWQYPTGAGMPTGPTELPPADEMDRDAEERLRKIVSEELASAADAVRTEVGRGPAGDVLLRIAARGSVETMVLGARGLGGFDGMLLGSVTQRCVEHAPCTVVIMRDGVSSVSIPPTRLLVGLDGSDEAVHALDWAMDSAQALDAEILLAHALALGSSGQDREAAERMVDDVAQRVHDRGIRHSSWIGEIDPRSALLRVAEDEDVDLVVVGSRGLGPLPGLLLGSVSGYLVRYARRPIAVVPGELEP